MKSQTSTKHAFRSSVVAVLLCVAMLIGTTFAWFTDTASTAVNKIEAGTLKVDIQDANGNSLQGKTLSWQKAEGHENETVLWEPGAKYNLTPFKIVSTGNLALKYKIIVSGLTGDADLLNALTFTYTENGEAVDLSTEGHLTAEQRETGLITITGEMNKNAGNEYQGKSIDGISITVYATQDTVESDSFGNEYDRNAAYSPVIDYKGLTQALSAGGEIAVDADVMVDGTDTRVWRTEVTKPTTLKLNKKILSPDNMGSNLYYNYAALFVLDDTTIEAGKDGGINTGVNGAYAIAVKDGAKLTINGGNYYGGGTAIQVENGELTINGGFFAVEPFDNPQHGNKFLLNCIDKNYNDGTAKITVKGGTFVNYDPSNSESENPTANFVAKGYSVVKTQQANGDTWYTVVKGTGVVPANQESFNSGITASEQKDVALVLPQSNSFTLNNGIANEGEKARNITVIGNGTQTVDVVTKAVTAEGGKLNYQRGSTFTFENVTVQAGEGSFDGIVCDELVYKNCTIKGKLTLYGKATFINCTFENTMDNQYSIWTWGGTNVQFSGCTFNTNGKAILLYGQATAAKPTNLVVNDCVFNDRKNGTAGKAAIEVGNDYNATYTLTVNNSKVNGFAAGKNTGSTVWANKNSMDAAHLTVTIDGTKVQ